MLFGFASRVSRDDDTPELCIMADKPAFFSVPIKVKDMRATDAAVHFVSIEEAFTVTTDAHDNGKIITAVRPNVIYLTPNLPQRPGFSVDRVKVVYLGNNQFSSYFDRGKGWENWTPNIRIL